MTKQQGYGLQQAAKGSLLARARLALKKYWFIYLLALPGLVTLIIFSYGPMYGIQLAFKDYKINLGVWGSPFVGLQHYQALFSDNAFIQAFKNTVIINLYHLIFGFTFNVFLALMINEILVKPLKSVVQTLVYLPYFLSWVIFAGLVQVFLQAPVPGDVGGVVNQIIVAMGGEAIDFMKTPSLFRGLLVITNIIKTSGYSTIIYLAAISGVDPNLYEAAAIDGANRKDMLVYITFPRILPSVAVLFLLNISQLFLSNFDQEQLRPLHRRRDLHLHLPHQPGRWRQVRTVHRGQPAAQPAGHDRADLEQPLRQEDGRHGHHLRKGGARHVAFSTGDRHASFHAPAPGL